MRMNKNGFVKRVGVAVGFLFLCAAPGLSSEQTAPPSAAPPPQITSPPARPGNKGSPPDFFAGLTFTDDQKAKIDAIHEDTKSRLEAVANDKKLSPEAKDAMLSGYHRIENSKIFDVLTPEQQREVHKRISAWRAAARQHPHQLPQPHPPERKSQPE